MATSQLIDQPTAAPTNKVAAVGIAGIVAVIVPLIVTILAGFGVIIPDELTAKLIASASAIVTIYAAVQAVVQFAAGYFKRNEVK